MVIWLPLEKEKGINDNDNDNGVSGALIKPKAAPPLTVAFSPFFEVVGFT